MLLGQLCVALSKFTPGETNFADGSRHARGIQLTGVNEKTLLWEAAKCGAPPPGKPRKTAG